MKNGSDEAFFLSQTALLLPRTMKGYEFSVLQTVLKEEEKIVVFSFLRYLRIVNFVCPLEKATKLGRMCVKHTKTEFVLAQPFPAGYQN